MAKHVTDHPLTEAEIDAIDQAATACPGAIYRSTDTRKFWVGADDGTLIGPITGAEVETPRFYGDFFSDTEAGQNGVPLNGGYFLTPINQYGLPGGSPKKRVEQ
jgi:hypothetical protein